MTFTPRHAAKILLASAVLLVTFLILRHGQAEVFEALNLDYDSPAPPVEILVIYAAHLFYLTGTAIFAFAVVRKIFLWLRR